MTVVMIDKLRDCGHKKTNSPIGKWRRLVLTGYGASRPDFFTNGKNIVVFCRDIKHGRHHAISRRMISVCKGRKVIFAKLHRIENSTRLVETPSFSCQ